MIKLNEFSWKFYCSQLIWPHSRSRSPKCTYSFSGRSWEEINAIFSQLKCIKVSFNLMIYPTPKQHKWLFKTIIIKWLHTHTNLHHLWAEQQRWTFSIIYNLAVIKLSAIMSLSFTSFARRWLLLHLILMPFSQTIIMFICDPLSLFCVCEFVHNFKCHNLAFCFAINFAKCVETNFSAARL